MKRERTRVVTLMGGMMAMSLAYPAAATEPATVAGQIADLETRYSQTFVTGDVGTAGHILADAFIGFGSDGKVTDKAGMLAEVRSEPHQTSSRITSVTVRVHGDIAVARGTEDDTSPGTEVTAHRMWLDTWKRTATGWEMVASAEIAMGR